MGSIRPYITYGKRYRRFFFTIDDEGLYVIPYGSLLGEIARVPYPITFQCPDTNRLIGF